MHIWKGNIAFREHSDQVTFFFLFGSDTITMELQSWLKFLATLVTKYKHKFVLFGTELIKI